MIEFISSNALRKLNELSIGTVRINAAVCYWTLPPSELAPEFLSALCQEGSCLVVDIHTPTSVDSLSKFSQAGAKVFLYMFQIVGKTEVADSKGIPDQLMHAKIFVFDYGTADVKIWVGSHNGTRRAMLGLNLEFATVISCGRDSPLHREALQFIENTKNVSAPFRRSEVELYKRIQNNLETEYFIELQEASATPLANNSVFSIFGTRKSDYSQLQTVGKSVFVSITDSSSGVESIYRATIEHSGYFDRNSKDTQFDSRRYAIKDSAAIPVLGKKQAIPTSIYTKCKYFVKLKIDSPLLNQYAADVPEDRLWSDVSEERYLRGIKEPISGQAAIVTRERDIAKFRIQGVNLGQADSIFDSAPIAEVQRTLQVLEFSARRQRPNQPLIRKKILVDRID